MDEIKNKINKLFDIYAILPYEDLPQDREKLTAWLNIGSHGIMKYMEKERCDLRIVLPEVRSVIVVGLSYADNKSIKGRALYACSTPNYHKKIKLLLWQVIEIIKSMYPDVRARAIVDTAPAMEKAWAIRGGLGARGRNSLVVNKKMGSLFNIGMIVTDIELDMELDLELGGTMVDKVLGDTPKQNNMEMINAELNNVDLSNGILPQIKNKHPVELCSDCEKCIKACPTKAINLNRTINATKCISYHTVERTRIEKQQITMNNWTYGCDICQMVCPYNLYLL